MACLRFTPRVGLHSAGESVRGVRAPARLASLSAARSTAQDGATWADHLTKCMLSVMYGLLAACCRSRPHALCECDALWWVPQSWNVMPHFIPSTAGSAAEAGRPKAAYRGWYGPQNSCPERFVLFSWSVAPRLWAITCVKLLRQQRGLKTCASGLAFLGRCMFFSGPSQAAHARESPKSFFPCSAAE